MRAATVDCISNHERMVVLVIKMRIECETIVLRAESVVN